LANMASEKLSYRIINWFTFRFCFIFEYFFSSTSLL